MRCAKERKVSQGYCVILSVDVDGRSLEKGGYPPPFPHGETETLRGNSLHKVVLSHRARVLSQRCCWLMSIPSKLTVDLEVT